MVCVVCAGGKNPGGLVFFVGGSGDGNTPPTAVLPPRGCLGGVFDGLARPHGSIPPAAAVWVNCPSRSWLVCVDTPCRVYLSETMATEYACLLAMCRGNHHHMVMTGANDCHHCGAAGVMQCQLGIQAGMDPVQRIW